MADRPIPGHVFVVKGDVTKIKCDAWLCPTDDRFSVTSSFGPGLGYPGRTRLPGHHWEGHQAIPFRPATAPSNTAMTGPSKTPLIVLGNVGRDTPQSEEQTESTVKELLPVLTEFTQVAKREVPSPEERPLRLALPLIGTGRGGLAGKKGDVIEPLLGRLNELAVHECVDFVLCTVRDVDWAAVQSVRHPGEWNLPAKEERWAQSLAYKARTKSLVLFIGAGASLDAGLPDWKKLLDDLCPRAISREDRAILSKLDHRDYATIIEREIGGPQKLLKQIHKIVGGGRKIGLTHALLASIGVEQSITTNYDDLFEMAHRSPLNPDEHPITVLPYEPVQEGKPWLLKLHGSIEHDLQTVSRGQAVKPTVVLTRSDYMNLARERSALFGIVQALLVTKHLLFVGYSLSDDSFHQLVNEIRLALGSHSTGNHRDLGTVLTVEKWPMADVWSDILNVRNLIGPSGDPVGRHQLIFLDRVAHLSTPGDAYLLDESFRKLLKPDERRIAAKLAGVQSMVGEILSNDPTNKIAQAVMAELKRFGAR